MSQATDRVEIYDDHRGGVIVRSVLVARILGRAAA